MKALPLVVLVLVICLIYYGFKYIIKRAPSFLLKRWMKNMQRRSKQDVTYKSYQEGDTEVSYKKDKQVDPGGDYVDFEDVNDNK
tara:strand:+ start:338 stop:589 length:252 start_codon:yes stop_codon:yes gene_type:complete